MHDQLDPRLREVYELLRSVVGEPSEAPEATSSHWELPVLPPPDPDGQLSSTDLLSWWFRAPRGGSDPWADFFAAPERSPTGDRPAADSRMPRTGATGATDVPAGQAIESPLAAALFPEPEEQLAEEHAQAAVERLYEFLHAIGRLDVDAAMACIAEDYHAIEDEEEVDGLRLRHNLESHLDSLRGWDLEVSLAKAPEPLSHPYGILIAAEIQIDAYHPETDAKQGLVEKRVAVLVQDAVGGWKIRALSRVDR